ncbi:MAG: hypothetical protein JST86_20300 [Bacteroidetes bacterium]|nr:hypothetical protein [Bacteroidota bacterium]
MKNLIAASVLIATISSCLFVSCAKTDHSSDLPKEQQVVGQWSINRIQLKLFYGGVFTKDSILPQKALPKNFVQFDANSNFQYCFNSSTINNGSYQFKGSDSLISTTSAKIYRWKWLTLTDVLFTVMSTSSSDPNFPGATVETYQTFVR